MQLALLTSANDAYSNVIKVEIMFKAIAKTSSYQAIMCEPGYKCFRSDSYRANDKNLVRLSSQVEVMFFFTVELLSKVSVIQILNDLVELD